MAVDRPTVGVTQETSDTSVEPPKSPPITAGSIWPTDARSGLVVRVFWISVARAISSGVQVMPPTWRRLRSMTVIRASFGSME